MRCGDERRAGQSPLVLMDLRPLRASRDFRLLIASRSITQLGTEATVVALMFQVKSLSHSPFAVGLLGLAELVPLVLCGLYGGVLADRLDRRKVAVRSEAGLGLLILLLAGNALLPSPQLWFLYVGAAALMALTALQRPSLDAALPRVVPRDQLTAASALFGLIFNVAMIVGPAIGGLLAAGVGPMSVYLLDAVSYALSFLFLLRLGALPAIETTRPRVLQGLRYAIRRQDLVGSYLADLAAMIFAYPTALFPFVAADLHASWALGLMYSAISVGALLAAGTSAWAGRVHRHGVAIAASAVVWGAAIAAFGLAWNLYAGLAFLVVAGAADEVSGIFRQTLWNQSVPDEMRGRLAGVELLSYGIGPSAGQLRAGGMASIVSTRFSLWSGGLICVAAVGAICAALPGFRKYDARASRPRV